MANNANVRRQLAIGQAQEQALVALKKPLLFDQPVGEQFQIPRPIYMNRVPKIQIYADATLPTVPRIQRNNVPIVQAIGNDQQMREEQKVDANQPPPPQLSFREKMLQSLYDLAAGEGIARINVVSAKESMTRPLTDAQIALATGNNVIRNYLANDNSQKDYKAALKAMYTNMGINVKSATIRERIDAQVSASTKKAKRAQQTGPSDKYQTDAVSIKLTLNKGPKIAAIMEFVSKGYPVLTAIKNMTGVHSVGVTPNGAAYFQYRAGERQQPISKLKKDVIRIKNLLGKSLRARGQNPRINMPFQKLNQVVIPMLKALTCYNELGSALSRFTSSSKKFTSKEAFNASLQRALKGRAKGLPMRLVRQIVSQGIQLGQLDPANADTAFVDLIQNYATRAYLKRVNDNKLLMIPQKVQKIIDNRNKRVAKAPQTAEELAANMSNAVIDSYNLDTAAYNQYLIGPQRGTTLFPKKRRNAADEENANRLRFNRKVQLVRTLKTLRRNARNARDTADNRRFREQDDLDESYQEYIDNVRNNVQQGNETFYRLGLGQMGPEQSFNQQEDEDDILNEINDQSGIGGNQSAFMQQEESLENIFKQ